MSRMRTLLVNPKLFRSDRIGGWRPPVVLESSLGRDQKRHVAATDDDLLQLVEEDIAEVAQVESMVSALG